MRGENIGIDYENEVQDSGDTKRDASIKQLKTISQIIKDSKADPWYEFFNAKRLFHEMASDDALSPFTRIVSKTMEMQLARQFGEKVEIQSDHKAETIRHTNKESDLGLGYSRIIQPEQFGDGVISRELEDMDETQLREALDNEMRTETKNDGDYIDYMTRINELELALERLDYLRKQSKIHDEFPALPKEKMALKIASDAAVTVDFVHSYGEEDSNDDFLYHFDSVFDDVCDTEGHIATFESMDELFELDKEIIPFITMVHNNNELKDNIEEIFGLNLSEIPIRSQAHLLTFMIEADNKRFDRLCSTLQGIDEKLRLKLAENFIAADFGEDFGDSLLTIAESEKLSNAEKEKLFDTISTCRESISNVTGLYEGYDGGKFAMEYRRAANERLTDAIAVFEKIARDGVAEANLDWAGQPHFDYATAMEALEYEAKSLEIISEVIGDVRDKKEGAFAEIVLSPDDSLQRLRRTFYNIYSPEHGYVLLYTRPEGSHSFDPALEYGKVRSRYDTTTANVGVEASISFIANPIDPFSLPDPYRPDHRAVRNPRFYDEPTMNKVSAIRLDREGRAPGMAADSPERDPINPIGMVSVDLAAIGDRADTPSGKIARLLSVGGKLREETHGKESSLNHNTKWFDQESYGTEDGFRGLVEYVDAIVTKWCHGNKPGDKVDSFTKRKREVSRARGHKARAA